MRIFEFGEEQLGLFWSELADSLVSRGFRPKSATQFQVRFDTDYAALVHVQPHNIDDHSASHVEMDVVYDTVIYRREGDTFVPYARGADATQVNIALDDPQRVAATIHNRIREFYKQASNPNDEQTVTEAQRLADKLLS